jgi:hypothetical protein
MKKRIILLMVILVMALAFCACTPAEPVSTALGEFLYEQEFMPSVGEDTAADGNTFLVIRLTPTEGTEVTLDEAHDFFYDHPTQAVVDGETYDLYCLAYEQAGDKSMRYALLFEVKDNGYEDAKEPPTVTLKLANPTESTD